MMYSMFHVWRTSGVAARSGKRFCGILPVMNQVVRPSYPPIPPYFCPGTRTILRSLHNCTPKAKGCDIQLPVSMLSNYYGT